MFPWWVSLIFQVVMNLPSLIKTVKEIILLIESLADLNHKKAAIAELKSIVNASKSKGMQGGPDSTAERLSQLAETLRAQKNGNDTAA